MNIAILAAGRADLVVLARPHLIDLAFTLKAAAWYGADVRCPPQYRPGWEQIGRTSVRECAEFTELKLEARPLIRAGIAADRLCAAE